MLAIEWGHKVDMMVSNWVGLQEGNDGGHEDGDRAIGRGQKVDMMVGYRENKHRLPCAPGPSRQ